ncbi:alpha/beta hydrolase [Paenibacillus lautus]|jgi:pimeloyl-ACP methyl ester carboxylesterase|uniref:Alpha/beta fold hydrolase n=1 Tax=Paenibacillus lautus TaxID=1401 RepID=A0A385TPB3_PAELA|nr:alpha/beta fold hydrolase [Paenibacillus lautus]AYB46300.1 alpha/beta fold hydrolase [Paenibacillus lautus]MCI1777130.1 alpha/beta hydrolase [Paenibacillus lautus]VTR62613.1 acetoin dehydrogenase E2 subunit dihydrolipoyllysine-residue acetyltransferase [Actinobacillus pleuropneumoniae]
MERQITIRHNQEELTATIHYPLKESAHGSRCNRVPLVIICHGFVGSRIGVDRLFVKTAREFAEDGYMVIRFDYIGCGESSGNYGSEGLDSMIAQTRSVLDYGLSCTDVDPTRITLLGHSLGGAVALQTAVRDRRVKNLILWSAVGYPFNDIVKITGRDVYDTSVKSGSADYLGYSFTPVFFDSLAQGQPFQEAIKFTGNVLVIHGTSDEVIPVDYAFLFQKVFWMRQEGRCDKEIIFQADHTYSAGPQRQLLLERTRDWLNEQENIQQEWQHWMI